MESAAPSLEGLPGGEIVSAGLEDLRAGRDTVEAAAVLMASDRLRALGIEIDAEPSTSPASHHLYALLAAVDSDDAHSRYNAILGRIASFARAAERARAR